MCDSGQESRMRRKEMRVEAKYVQSETKIAHVPKGNVQARRGEIRAVWDENRACAEGKCARKMRRVIDSPWIFLYDILILTKGFRIPS